MQVYRSTMEKLLKQMEDNEIITNPKHAFRSLRYKFIYRCRYHINRLNQVTRCILGKRQ